MINEPIISRDIVCPPNALCPLHGYKTVVLSNAHRVETQAQYLQDKSSMEELKNGGELLGQTEVRDDLFLLLYFLKMKSWVELGENMKTEYHATVTG